MTAIINNFALIKTMASDLPMIIDVLFGVAIISITFMFTGMKKH